VGRWAQAQRRGGFAAAGTPPLIDCANVVTSLHSVGADVMVRMTAIGGGIPAGVTAVAWSGGVGDCTEQAGVVTLGTLPQDLFSVGDVPSDYFIQFAWMVGGDQQPFGCECTLRSA